MTIVLWMPILLAAAALAVAIVNIRHVFGDLRALYRARKNGAALLIGHGLMVRELLRVLLTITFAGAYGWSAYVSPTGDALFLLAMRASAVIGIVLMQAGWDWYVRDSLVLYQLSDAPRTSERVHES